MQNVMFHSYSDAIRKLESALKTEPKLDFYVLKAKTQICHCHRMVRFTSCNILSA